jgi:hypothetical protein
MITDNKYFETGIEEINSEITSYNKKIGFLKKCSIHDFSNKNITQMFSDIFKVLPYEIETASDFIGISIYTRELFHLFYKISDNDVKIDISNIEKAKQEFKVPKIVAEDKYLIVDFFDDYFHSLTYKYGDILKNTMNHHFFHGITEERIILINLLKLYKNILNDKSKQLSHFWGITLTKKISDIATKMLIDFIEQRLIMINPQLDLESIPNKMTFIDNNLKSIEWLGTQQELCELLIELIDKNWIPKIEEGERKNIAKTITNLFDLSHTKRNEKSNPDESFYQQFKGQLMDGERYYDFLESKKYVKKFNKIGKNN